MDQPSPDLNDSQHVDVGLSLYEKLLHLTERGLQIWSDGERKSDRAQGAPKLGAGHRSQRSCRTQLGQNIVQLRTGQDQIRTPQSAGLNQLCHLIHGLAIEFLKFFKQFELLTTVN